MNVLVIGLDHWIHIRRLIQERRIEAVAEEAGNDNAVAEGLQRDENAWAPLEGREPRRIEPLETIARTITRALNDCRHEDIRPAGDWPDPRRPEYEQAMLKALLAAIADTNSALVLCGEFHRRNVLQALTRGRLRTQQPNGSLRPTQRQVHGRRPPLPW